VTLLGLWVDDPPRTVAQPAYWDQLRDIGVRVAAIMLDSVATRWDPRYTPAQVEAVCRMAIDRDIEVVLTTWPSPHAAEMRRMRDDMAELLRLGAVGWEVDLEGNWKASRVVGFTSLDEAAKMLVTAMHEARSRSDIRLELTTHTGHHELTAGARVAPHMDRVLPQAYSTRRDWQSQDVAWSSVMGPGRRQTAALAQTRTIPGVEAGRPRVSVGLAAWDQQWPGRTVEEALSVALEAALAVDPVEVRYWSSKWLVGAKRRPAVLAAWRAATGRLTG
jgi:hypothetical protein